MFSLDAEERVIELISSNLYEIVSLDDIKRAADIKISRNNQGYLEDTLEDYKKYIKLIESLPEKIRQGFLETLKRNEIKHNQKAENQDMFMLELYRTLDVSNSIDLGISILDEKEILTVNDLEKLHDKILEGTGESSAKGYRTKDDKVVEGMKNGKRDIHFIPIKKDEIKEAMALIIQFINAEAKTEEELFTIPFIAHALIGITQAFPDGNTRLARLIHQLKIWDLTRKFNISYLNMPALYMSKSFYMMRGNYRENLRRIVIDKDDVAWNKWISFSLDAVNEQLNYGTNNLERIKRGL